MSALGWFNPYRTATEHLDRPIDVIHFVTAPLFRGPSPLPSVSVQHSYNKARVNIRVSLTRTRLRLRLCPSRAQCDNDALFCQQQSDLCQTPALAPRNIAALTVGSTTHARPTDRSAFYAAADVNSRIFRGASAGV
eukprot:1180006-Prorocentrum_minimum.AAC.1